MDRTTISKQQSSLPMNFRIGEDLGRSVQMMSSTIIENGILEIPVKMIRYDAEVCEVSARLDDRDVSIREGLTGAPVSH